MVLLGIDVGTTSLKAAAFDETGRRLALCTMDYTLSTAEGGVMVEFEANEYLRICREAIARIRAEVGQIDAISVDTQGETMILTDEAGTPLAPAIVWLDNRAEAEAREIEAHFGLENFYNHTGQPEVTGGWPACKLLWVKRNRPEIWAKTKKIFLLGDWLLHDLGGEFVTEPTLQSSSCYYDITTGDWWPEMLDYIGITRDQLPRLIPSATAVAKFEEATVVTGALEQIAGSVGTGVVTPDIVSEMTGTIMAVCALCDEIPPFDPASKIPCHVHLDGHYCRLLWSPTAGMALKWFRNSFAAGVDFAALDKEAAEVPAGSEGLVFLPYLCGSTMPTYNPDARGLFGGITLTHGRGHFVRAILEAIAFMLDDTLRTAGNAIEELRITGGGAASPLWAQIKADVTGLRLCVPAESETACLGTAILAGVGAGAFASVEAGTAACVRTGKTYLPTGTDYTDAARRFRAYDKLFNNQEVSTCLK